MYFITIALTLIYYLTPCNLPFSPTIWWVILSLRCPFTLPNPVIPLTSFWLISIIFGSFFPYMNMLQHLCLLSTSSILKLYLPLGIPYPSHTYIFLILWPLILCLLWGFHFSFQSLKYWLSLELLFCVLIIPCFQCSPLLISLQYCRTTIFYKI